MTHCTQEMADVRGTLHEQLYSVPHVYKWPRRHRTSVTHAFVLGIEVPGPSNNLRDPGPEAKALNLGVLKALALQQYPDTILVVPKSCADHQT